MIEDTITSERERVERAFCAACQEQRAHEPEDWKNHPLAGHGIGSTHGLSAWTHPTLQKEFDERPKPK